LNIALISELKEIAQRLIFVVGRLEGERQSTQNNIYEFKKLNDVSAFLKETEEMPRKIKLFGKNRTILKRMDGRWQMSLAHKKQRHFVYDINQAVCIEKFKNLHKNIDKITDKEPKYKLSTWLYEWMQTYKKPTIKPQSLVHIETCVRLHLLTNIEDVELSKLNALEIQKGLNKIKSSRMKKYSYNVICEALKRAYKLKLTKDNIAEEIAPVKHQKKIGRSLTQEEQKQFLTAISGHRLEKVYLFYLYSGARKSEALNLKWNDIDFEKELLHIPGTKTKQSNRIIPLFPQIKKILQTVERKNKNVFNTTANIIKKDFERLREQLKIKGICIHSLRHTFATNCFEKGVPPKIIQKWLGHSTPQMTEQVYIHVSPEHEREAVKKLDFDITFDIIK
jgi:integrase